MKLDVSVPTILSNNNFW